MTFSDKLKQAVNGEIGVCVGLDPVIEKLPAVFHHHREPLFAFNQEIIAATEEYASAYKPNFAFYEAYGAAGWEQLKKTIAAVPPGKLIIGDAKRGDIGSTAELYAKAVYEALNCDAVTVNPYLGADSILPFLACREKGAYLLAVTSNPSGSEIQEMNVDGEPLFVHIIRNAKRLNQLDNIGLVAGATKTHLWEKLLSTAENLPLLIPGIGSQGGDIAAVRQSLIHYPAAVLVNASRSIIFASGGGDYAVAAREATKRLKDQLNGS